MNNILKQMYNFVLTVNIILFFLFIIINIENLDEIPIMFEVLGTTFNFTLNFYLLIGVVSAIYVILIVLGISIFGSGFSDGGVHRLSKIITLLVLVALFTIIDSYFFLVLGAIGVYIELFFTMVYFFYGINDISNEVE